MTLEKPLIICEGKTDVVYLKIAIKQLKKQNKYLLQYPFNFFHYTDRISEVMQITAGTDALKNFVINYKNNIAFTKLNPCYPVIVMLDNDKKAGEVVKILHDKFNQPNTLYDRTQNFIYPVIENLYVVLLPTRENPTKKNLKKELDVKIEDFFEKSVLDIKLGEKTFSPENGSKFDSSRHYSKQILAEKIIRPKQDTINFSHFTEILDTLVKAIELYKPVHGIEDQVSKA